MVTDRYMSQAYCSRWELNSPFSHVALSTHHLWLAPFEGWTLATKGIDSNEQARPCHLVDLSHTPQVESLRLYPACQGSFYPGLAEGGKRKTPICMSSDKGSHRPREMPLLPLPGSPSLLSWFARSFCFFLLVASSNPGGPLLGPAALAPADILSLLVDSQSAPESATASGSGLRRFLPGPAILATLCGQILQQRTKSLMKIDQESLPRPSGLLQASN